MKIQYGIAGFVIGIMTGILLGVIEMKLIIGTKHAGVLPFVIGITVFACIITGVTTGVRMAKRKLND
jgi:hypothetical protein